MVAVISKSGAPLMPTNTYRARRLLKSGKAVICNYKPFAIRLLNHTTEDIQDIEYCMDTGYLHIGNSVKSEKHEYLPLQVIRSPMSVTNTMTAACTVGHAGTGNATGSRGLIIAKHRKAGFHHPYSIK